MAPESAQQFCVNPSAHKRPLSRTKLRTAAEGAPARQLISNLMANGGTIFGLVNGKLVEMNEGPYLSEDVLQKHLQDHVKLLAGEQIDPLAPRRWLLVAREMSVPDVLDGKERWSLDHLFVDQDGIPTLVEVKRSTNTEIRRQIVGQLLDYAANGTQYWTIGKIREAFTTTCLAANVKENETLLDFLVPDGVTDSDTANLVEGFWSQVQQNMEDGRIRMLFVADVIPNELKRVIEFLNRQMNPAQVMGVEIRQYIGGDITAFVPRVFPQTIGTQALNKQKSSTPNTDTTRKLFEAKRIPIGAEVRFEPAAGNSEEVNKRLTQDAVSTVATWEPEPTNIWLPLKWTGDNKLYSATGLAKKLYELAGRSKTTLRGPACWFYEGKSLVDLANEL